MGTAGVLLPTLRTDPSPTAAAWPQGSSPSHHHPHPPQRDPRQAHGFTVLPCTPAPRAAPLLLCDVPVPARPPAPRQRCPGQPLCRSDPEHRALPGTSVTPPVPPPADLLPAQLPPPAEPPARGAMGQARLCWQPPPARAGSGHREGKGRPRSTDGASRSGVRWKHHPWWGTDGLHPEKPLRRPLGDQGISTGSAGSPALPRGCPGREVAAVPGAAAQALPPGHPRGSDTQDTADLFRCCLAAWMLLGDNLPAPARLLCDAAELVLPETHHPAWLGRVVSPSVGGKGVRENRKRWSEVRLLCQGAKTWPRGT